MHIYTNNSTVKYNNSMSVKIDYSNKSAKDLSANTVLFVDEKFNIKNIIKYLSNSEISYINDLLQTNSKVTKAVLGAT